MQIHLANLNSRKMQQTSLLNLPRSITIFIYNIPLLVLSNSSLHNYDPWELGNYQGLFCRTMSQFVNFYKTLCVNRNRIELKPSRWILSFWNVIDTTESWRCIASLHLTVKPDPGKIHTSNDTVIWINGRAH